MATLLFTHPAFTEHDTGPGHPERPDRMRAIDKVLGHDLFNSLQRAEAPLREDVEEQILLAHPKAHLEKMRAIATGPLDGRLRRHVGGVVARRRRRARRG
jgi:acetoin utilization deacetylase AcuC-like enzyme